MDIELHNLRVVAVDGGTATGKGRLIDELAQFLRLKGVPVIHASTGSIYRAVALVAIEEAAEMVIGRSDMTISEINHTALELVRDMPPAKLLELAGQRQVQMHGGQMWIDGAGVAEEHLKGPAMGTGASIVGLHPEVRDWISGIVRRQINEFNGFALIDGRDITHVVVPDAPVKLLLVVSPEVAATRSREHTIEEIVARDSRDRGRKHGALRHPENPGDGVIVLTTDAYTPEALRDYVYTIMQKAFSTLPDI